MEISWIVVQCVFSSEYFALSGPPWVPSRVHRVTETLVLVSACTGSNLLLCAAILFIWQHHLREYLKQHFMRQQEIFIWSAHCFTVVSPLGSYFESFRHGSLSPVVFIRRVRGLGLRLPGLQNATASELSTHECRNDWHDLPLVSFYPEVTLCGWLGLYAFSKWKKYNYN